MGLILFAHALVCILLVVLILMQSGRGGGLTESFAAAESMLGAQTNSFLTKGTTILVVFFFVSCLGLAIMSAKKDKSLMMTRAAEQAKSVKIPVDVSKAANEAAEAVSEAKTEAVNEDPVSKSE